MKLGMGMQLWLRDNHFENFHRMLDELALLGFDGVECCWPFLADWYESKPAELKRLLDLHGLELCDYYTGISFETAGGRAQGIVEFKRRARLAAAVGSPFLLLDGGGKGYQAEFESVEDYIACIAETANDLGAYARTLGLTMAWHQHWGSLFDTRAYLYRFLELTDPALVGFCPDVAQLTLSGFDVLETLRQTIQRIQFIHFKDVAPNGPAGRAALWPGRMLPADPGAYDVDSKWRMVELGRGVVPFPEVTEILRQAGYNGWLVDDFDFTGYPAYDSAQACKEYINRGLGIWGEREIGAAAR